MKQMDDNIGEVLKKLEAMGQLDNTLVVFTTDNGAEAISFPDGGVTPFKGQKGEAWEGGFRAPWSSAGPVTLSQERSRTSCSLLSIGCRRWSISRAGPKVTLSRSRSKPDSIPVLSRPARWLRPTRLS